MLLGVKTKNARRASARNQSIPSSLQVILDSFSDCFTRPSFGNFTHLVTGWLLCRSRRWITSVFAIGGLRPRGHHSRYYRFFSAAKWDPDKLGAVLFRLLLPHLPERIEVAVDDTLCRRGGPRIFGISMHHDGAASNRSQNKTGPFSKLACGHSWVVLAVLIPLPWSERCMSVPVLVRLYRSPKRCSKAEYRKRTELARSMVETLAGWLPSGSTLHLTGDREYACKTLLRDLSQEIQFTGPMPMNASLFAPVPEYAGKGRPRCRGKCLASPKARARSGRGWTQLELKLYGRKAKLQIKTWTCLWYTATGQRLVRIVLTRDPKGKYADRAFFSTEHELAPEEILKLYAHRWLIEVSFRDVKQHLGLNDPQNGWSRGKRSLPIPGPRPRGKRGRKAAERTAPFAWMIYGIIVVWYLGENRWRRDVTSRTQKCPWYRSKRAPSFYDMLNAARIEIMAHRLLKRPLRNRTLAETRKTLKTLGIAA